jgi:anti-anti-sigma factor
MDIAGRRSADRLTGHEQFDVTRDEFADRIVVRVAGEIDMATAIELRSALSPDGGRPIVIDLTETTFMDSSGLNALVAAWHSGAVAAVRHPTPTVRRAIEIAGLDQVLTIEP